MSAANDSFEQHSSAPNLELQRAVDDALKNASRRAALYELSIESRVVQLAARALLARNISVEQVDRVRVAVERIDAARRILE